MDKYCISLGYTIKEAIERIDAAKNRVILVINDEARIVGVISQGDIIRALISGKNLYTRIDSIIRPDFLYLNERNMEEAYILFKKIKITLLPVVDKDFHITDVISMDDIFDFMEEKCKN